MTTPVVRPPAGPLAGAWDGAVAVFRGIPFAAAPVGPLRWRPAQPAARWTDVRPAVEFGPAPLQPAISRTSVMYHTNFVDRVPPTFAEDCLYLNVWTPDPTAGADHAVMVWLHGGGNLFGYGSQDIHNGARLAARGIVVVTLNYRLGPLGFLSHPALAADDGNGNYGLSDIVAALVWVRDNIEAFGGDPARVTVAGNSAGAAHLTHLMAVPAARGLFRAGIAQSASGIFRAEGPLPTVDESSAVGSRLHPGSADDLRHQPGAAFVRPGHVGGADQRSIRGGADQRSICGPVVDGGLVVEQTQDVYAAGRQAPVPLMAGSNADEGSVYAGPADLNRVADHGPTYPPGPESARLFVGESRFVYPVWRWASEHVRTAGAPVWLYRFEHAPPLPDRPDLAPPPDGLPGYGAYHSAEMPYMTDNLDRRPWAWTEADRALATLMADTWARFVTDAHPGLSTWEPFNGTPTGRTQVFSTSPRAAPVARPAALALLATLSRPLR